MFLSRLWILVSLAIGAASDNYKKLGGDAVLSPSSMSDRITSITWKHGADIAVEWYGQETVAYREFKDRCELDFKTGALTISNLTVKDSGVYTAEINNRVMSPTEITVISAVPKPTVSTQCISEGTRCTFTCEASISGAEPVTYSWMVDGKNITGSSKSLQREKDDPEMVGKPISCQLENPVSSARSNDVIIPFTNVNVGAIVGGVAGTVIVIVIVVAVGLFIRRRHRPGGQDLNEVWLQQETSEDAQDRAHETTPFISQNNEVKAQISMSNGTAVAYTKAGEIHNQEQNSESKQSKHEPEPSGRSQDDTPGQTEEGAEEPSGRSQDDTPGQTEEGAEEPSGRSQDKADEEEAQISMSNGTVAFTTVDEIHNQEQNSESTQSKHEPETSGRSQDDTPGQTEEGAEDTSEEGTPEL